MIGRLSRAGILTAIVTSMLALTACEGSNPTGVPFRALGRETAGVYSPDDASANLNMRLVLGTRHSATGRYADASGADVRFSGTWRRDGGRVVVTLSDQPGMPGEIVFDVTREVTRTQLPCTGFCTTPENNPLFLEREVLRLRATAVIAGQQHQLNLIRILTDVGQGGGGPTQS